MPSKLYDPKTAQEVLDKYPKFPQFNQEKCKDILRQVYGKVVNGQHIELLSYWEIQAVARKTHKRLGRTLDQPESRLERKVRTKPKRKRRKQTIETKVKQTQTFLFDTINPQ